MTPFEEQLQKAMRRVDAPPALMRFLEAAVEVEREHTMPRAKRKHRRAFLVPRFIPRFAARPQLAALMTSAVAALLAVGVFAGEHAYRRHEQTVRATQQFETATRITDKALAHTREQLARAGVPLD
jgi:hypothetical protein